MKNNKIHAASFSFTIPSGGMEGALQFVTLPILDKKSIDKAMRYELEDNSGLEKFDNYYAQWEKLTEDTIENKMKSIAAMMKKDLLHEISKLKKISWSIESVEFQAATIGRMVNGNSIVVDYGHINTAVYHYLGGVLEHIELIPSGGKRINEIIRDVLPEVSDEELETLKKEAFFYGAENPIKERVEEPLIKPIINIEDLSNLEEAVDKDILMEISLKISQEARYVSEEIKRFIRQFELEHSILVDNLYHVGETFKLKTFIEYLSEDLDINLKPLSDVVTDEDFSQNEEFILAYLATKSKEIDYLKTLNFHKHVRNNVDFSSLGVAALLMSLIIHGGVYFVTSQYKENTTAVNTQKSEQAQTISALDSEIQEFQSRMNTSQAIVEAVEKIGGERKWMSDFLYRLPDIVPNGIALRKITAQDGLIVLRGYAKNYSNIGFLAMELEKIGPITIDYIQKETDWDASDISKIRIENEKPKEELTVTSEFTIRVKTPFPITITED